MAHVYILFSPSLSKHYIGVTNGKPLERLKKHLTNHKGFTAKAKDWVIVHAEQFDDYSMALKREKQLKAWKNPERIRDLILRVGSEHPD